MITLNENGTLKYVSSGLFQSDGSWIHPRVTIETYEIIFMYEGTAYICEDGTEYILHPDDVLILDPDRDALRISRIGGVRFFFVASLQNFM